MTAPSDTAPPDPAVLQIQLTADELREFTACASMCGLSVQRWIVQCAAVKAADVIDAMQAPARRRLAASLAENEAINAGNRARRARRAREQTP